MQKVRITICTSYDCEVPEDMTASEIVEWANNRQMLVPAEMVYSWCDIFDTDGNEIE